ncbi:hypothetical protein L2E82_53283 [Cichorium intybus]|nr:hypothetical protein L2E82_53283 [Cichorium intybus]
MQHNKGRTKGLREGRSESIRMETGRRVVEWLAIFNQKRKIEQCKGERSCPLFSGNPPPHMSKKRERGRKNNRFTLAHEVAGLARPADTTELVEEKESPATKHSRPQKRRPKNRQVVEDTSEEEAGGL